MSEQEGNGCGKCIVDTMMFLRDVEMLLRTEWESHDLRRVGCMAGRMPTNCIVEGGGLL
jgi:hypothetical protein